MSAAEPEVAPTTRRARRARRTRTTLALAVALLAASTGLARAQEPAARAGAASLARDADGRILQPASPLPPAAPCADVLAITHVTVVDVAAGALLPDRTVVVRDGLVASVAPSDEAPPPDEAVVLDATGRYLIPGLWDMHVHWYSPAELPLFLANGVTGVRLMFGSPMHMAWRAQQQAGELLAPRLLMGSRIVDGPKPVWPFSIPVADAEQGRAAVATALAEGADFVKVYSLLPHDAWRAVAEEARRRGVRFEGHVPHAVGVLEAAEAGQATIEHLTGVLTAGSTEEPTLREESVAGTGDGNVRSARAARTQDPDKVRALHARLARDGTWMCPTLTVLRSLSHLDDEAFLDDPRLAFMPDWLRAQWDPSKDVRLSRRSPESWAAAREAYEASREAVRAMHAAGVRFLAGTDALNPYCFPGFSLPDELELLVGCGLTPAEALRTATWNPAAYMGRTDVAGSVEAGKVADLVLLDQDPLADVAHVRGIAAVVAGGRLLPRAELDAILAAAAGQVDGDRDGDDERAR